jgi:alpha-maltose-1-phosphate synthase
MGIDVRVVRDAAGIADLEPAWRDLATSSAARLFGHPYWGLTWWRELGRGELRVATAWDGDRLVALAPLHRRPRGGLRVIQFLGHGLGTVSELLVAPGYEAAAEQVWRAVLDGSRSYLNVVEYPADGRGLAELIRLADPAIDVRPSNVCPYVEVDGSFDVYLETRSSELRRILRRADRAVERRGAEFRVELVTDQARADELMTPLTTLFSAAERANPRQHLLAPPWRGFTRALVHAAAEVGTLRLFVGWLDEQIAAFALAFSDGNSLAMWANRFDPELRDVSPGHLVSRAMVAEGFAEGVRRVDFLLGEGRYKRLWCTDATSTVTVLGARARPLLVAGHATAAICGRASRLRRRAHDAFSNGNAPRTVKV